MALFASCAGGLALQAGTAPAAARVPAGSAMNGNHAREGGGAVSGVVDSGWGSLTFRDSERRPVLIGSSDTP